MGNDHVNSKGDVKLENSKAKPRISESSLEYLNIFRRTNAAQDGSFSFPGVFDTYVV